MAKSIPEDLKALHLQKVNSYQVQNMLNTLKNDGLSVRSVKAAYDLLNQVYKAAVEFELVGENPLEQKALSVEERKKVLVAIESSGTYKPIIYIMIGMGLRIGETIALKWRNINFDSNTISINKAAKSTPKISNDGLVLGRSMEISGTKTACSERTLPIPQVVKENLVEWKTTYSEKFKNMETEDLVFPNKSGELRCYSGFRGQFERVLKERGNKCYRFRIYLTNAAKRIRISL